MRVLIVEGDPSMAQSLELVFRAQEFNPYLTDTGEEGLELAKIYDHDIIILGTNLPDLSIFEYVRRLRMLRVPTPILVISPDVTVEARVKCLGAGADDYVTIPFHRDELIGRMHAIVRRSRGHAVSVITTGDVEVDLEQNTVKVRGVAIHLTGKEFKILEMLSLRRNVTLTKDMILNQLYGGMDEPELKIIDVFICKLRKKLAAAGAHTLIETVWGRGYKISEPSKTVVAFDAA